MLDLGEFRRRAAVEVSRHGRLNGVVSLLEALADQEPLSADDYRLYFMAWRVTRVLRPLPADLAPARTTPPVATP